MQDPVLVAETATQQALDHLLNLPDQDARDKAIERFRLCIAVSRHAKPTTRAGRNRRIKEAVSDLRSLQKMCETDSHWRDAFENVVQKLRPLVNAAPEHIPGAVQEAINDIAEMHDCLPENDDWRFLLRSIAERLNTMTN